MPTEIVLLRPELPEHLEAVRGFSERVWLRARGPSYLRWRYVEPGFQKVYLALREGRCIAMLAAFRRPYLAGDETIHVHDSFDWYALPELRKSGVGVRLMQQMMREPEPVIVTGGTQDTRDLLPRMGFQTLDEVRRYALPLSAGRVAEALSRRRVPFVLGRAAFAISRPWFAPRRRGRSRSGRVMAVASLPGEALAFDPRNGGQGTIPIWTSEYLGWLTAGFPGVGHFLPLLFTMQDNLMGWLLLRFFTTSGGCEASIVDVRARERNEELYTWMISEAAVCAAGLSADLLSAGSTSSTVEAALRRNRFLFIGTEPIHVYAADRKGLPTPIVFGAHWGDQPLIPYPGVWWDDRFEAQSGG